MTRRGESNVFDVSARTAAAGWKGTFTVEIDGRNVSMLAADPTGKDTSTWQGTIGDKVECDEGSLCCAVSGTWFIDKNPAQIYTWKGRIVCDHP